MVLMDTHPTLVDTNGGGGGDGGGGDGSDGAVGAGFGAGGGGGGGGGGRGGGGCGGGGGDGGGGDGGDGCFLFLPTAVLRHFKTLISSVPLLPAENARPWPSRRGAADAS